MSAIVLTAAVRQNLLSLQDTAESLATTQGRLSTGKKVNSALDNPTNFFTAAGLDNRSSDISNLLDGISNGVQVLQAANTGITSLQKLVDSAKSVANQALQTQIGYSTKANVVSAAITNGGSAVTASDLRGAGTTINNSVTAASAVLNDTTGGGAANITGATKLAGTAGAASDNLASNITTGDTLTINGKNITFVNNGAGNTISSNGATIDLASATVQNVLTAIDTISGTGTASTISGGKITLNTGTSNDLQIAGSALTKLGLTAGTTQRTGLTLSFGAVGTGTATTVTFGDGTNGTVKSLADLNNKLVADNLVATLDTSGKLTVQTNNDNASASFPTVGGTAVSNAAGAFGVSNGAVTTTSPIVDTAAQATRANLISQYNNILNQIDTTAADSSYNGINLLNGDQLQLTFNETGKSKLNITGVNFSSSGLGLSALTAGTDFKDNNATNKVLATLTTVSSNLRSQASAFGSNLSVVQTRQDFNKNLVNVLQTGSANLTQADINTEAANSQALQTRQSLSVSALSLANQAQQSVLQLLR